MSWLCALGIHAWFTVWDNIYDSICSRSGCHAVKIKKLPSSREVKRLAIRRAAIIKFEYLRKNGILKTSEHVNT
jgi:hypothetical protein